MPVWLFVEFCKNNPEPNIKSESINQTGTTSNYFYYLVTIKIYYFDNNLEYKI